MSDPSSNQSSTPDQTVTAAQQTNQGGALLNGGSVQPQAEPVSEAIATNFSSASDAGSTKLGGASGEMGTYITNDPTTEKGVVNLHNNPDVPSAHRGTPQGKLPDTGAIQLPTSDEVNLPD